MTDSLTKPDKTRFRISAVAAMTGIPAVTIRMWERRYSAVKPLRSDAGIRLYNQEDVHRLRMIRACITHGDAVSQVATLDNPTLTERLESTRPATGLASKPLKVAIIGHWLVNTLETTPDTIDIYVRATQVEPSLPTVYDLDLIALEMDYLSHTQRDNLALLSERYPAARFLIVYRIGSERDVRHFESRGMHTIRGPVLDQQLIRSIQGLCTLEQQGHHAPDRLASTLPQSTPACLFTADELAKYSRKSTTVECECPRHVTELISNLKAFEDYSAHCENLSPADAQLHSTLHNISAKARRLMEDALQHVITAEGL